MKDLTAERLRQLIHYDPETGIFTRRFARKHHAAGTVIGSSWRGYKSIWLDGRTYQASRLAWLYMTGCWPKAFIDHKNRTPSDNRWINLREATYRQNNVNAGLRKDSVSGVKGVCRCSPNTWRARIRINGKRTHLGVFPSIEAAHAAYAAKAHELFGEFARAA